MAPCFRSNSDCGPYWDGWRRVSTAGWRPALRVPERPNFAFTGQVGDIWYVFVALGAFTYAEWSGIPYLEQILIPVSAFLSWMTLRWMGENLSSNGHNLPIEFKGSALGYIGWHVLMYISVFTIIGWAWVVTAWMRWICRNISGTRREIVFTASGWQMLWRSLLFGLACGLLIPLPWVLRWYTSWYVSQFELVERTAYAHA